MFEVKIRLFGAFRDYSEQNFLSFQFEPGTSLDQIKQSLAQKLMLLRPEKPCATLLAQSVLADESAVLCEDFVLAKSQELAIIPPVCGG